MEHLIACELARQIQGGREGGFRPFAEGYMPKLFRVRPPAHPTPPRRRAHSSLSPLPPSLPLLSFVFFFFFSSCSISSWSYVRHTRLSSNMNIFTQRTSLEGLEMEIFKLVFCLCNRRAVEGVASDAAGACCQPSRT